LDDPEVLGAGNRGRGIIDGVVDHLAHAIEPEGSPAGAALRTATRAADGRSGETEF